MSLATGRSGRDRSRRQRRAAIVGWLTCVALAGMMCTAVPPANAARGPSVQEQSACVGPWLEWGDPGQTADSPHGKAVQVLGDRYIDLWMAPDQSGFVVAVSRLSSEEVGPLTAALARQGLGTVTLVHRDFSRTDVNSLATLAARAVNTVGGWTWFGPHYGPGVVDIGARNAECAEQLAAAVKSATGVSPLVGAAADAANLPGWVSSGSPVVTIRIGEVVHLPIIPAPGAGVSNMSGGSDGLNVSSVKKAPKSKTARVAVKATKLRVARTAKAKFKVNVSVPGTRRPAGMVRVSWKSGHKTMELKPSAKGKLSVKLPRLRQGIYNLKVTFTAANGRAQGAAKPLKLTVA